MTSHANTTTYANPTTRAAAEHRIRQAEARIKKSGEAIAKDTQYIESIKAIIDTLPAGSTYRPATVRPEFAIGTAVTFETGRGENRKESEGVVVALRRNDAGKVLQYKLQSGEGFDTTYTVVYPGSITKWPEGAAEADDQQEAQGEASVPFTGAF